VLVVGALLSLMPVSVHPAGSWQVTVAGDGAIQRSISIPLQWLDRWESGDDDWVDAARRDPSMAAAELRSRLARFTAVVPLQPFQREGQHQMPDFGDLHLAIPSAVRKRHQAVLAQLAVRYDPELAAPLLDDREVLFLAARRLEQSTWADDEEIQRAQNLDRLLREATGFDGLRIEVDPSGTAWRNRDLNEEVGTLWRWWLFEFANTESKWRAWCELRRR
jgi:hypothetical protein